MADRFCRLCDSKWGLLGLHHYSVRELQKIPGIGEVKAVQLLCIAEIAKRISVAQAASNLAFHRPDTVAEYYMERLRHKNTEQVILILLDSKNRLDPTIKFFFFGHSQCQPDLTKGNTDLCPAGRAGGIMLLHNHPSGDPTPSKQDIIMTRRIKEVSDLIDIPLIDHIVIGDKRYTSFKQKGLL